MTPRSANVHEYGGCFGDDDRFRVNFDLECGNLAVGVNLATIVVAGDSAVCCFGFACGGVDDHADGGEGNCQLVEGHVGYHGAGAVDAVEC